MGRLAQRGVRTSRRPTEWLGLFTSSVEHTSSNNGQVTLLTSAQLAEYITPTIMRIRGVLGFTWNPGAAPSDFLAQIVMGVVVVTEQAAAALATPIADTDLDADWMLWDSFYVQGSDQGASVQTMHYNERVFDTKAMRRIIQPDNKRLIMSVSINLDGAVSGTLRENFIMRILVKGD